MTEFIFRLCLCSGKKKKKKNDKITTLFLVYVFFFFFFSISGKSSLFRQNTYLQNKKHMLTCLRWDWLL